MEHIDVRVNGKMGKAIIIDNEKYYLSMQAMFHHVRDEEAFTLYETTADSGITTFWARIYQDEE